MWGKHHEHGMDFESMTEEEAHNFANMLISVAVVIMFIYTAFWVTVCQAIYLCFIKKIMHHQDRLEKAFMFRNNSQIAAIAPQQVQQQVVMQAPTGLIVNSTNNMN